MNIEQLKALLLEYRKLSTANLSVQQTDRLVEAVTETHKKIEALSGPVYMALPTGHPEHGPHAPNGVGYVRYVCETNPMGFCLTKQAQIETLIYQVRTHASRNAGMGGRDDGVPADKMCGCHHPSNQVDMFEVIKSAVCLDKDMWPFFRVRPIRGESKGLTELRQELFCLTSIEPSSGSYEVGNSGSI